MPEWLIVFITCDCITIKMIRLGRKSITLAAACIPAAATVLFVESDER